MGTKPSQRLKERADQLKLSSPEEGSDFYCRKLMIAIGISQFELNRANYRELWIARLREAKQAIIAELDSTIQDLKQEETELA